MKRILILILMLWGTAQAQTVGQFRYDTTKFLKVGGRNHVMIPGIQRITDSTHKPLVMGPDSVIKVGTYWPGAGGGSGNTNSNIGAGYRWAVPNTNNIKTLFGTANLVIDSTTNTNALTLTPNITGLITQGTNVTITGNGTSGSPYVVNSSGGGGGSPLAYSPLVVTNDSVRYGHNILYYGAGTSESAATNSAAISEAILAASADNNAPVYIPQGIFEVNTITYDPMVPIIGQGSKASQLKSASAVPMFEYNSTNYKGLARIQGLFLNGDSIGTVGVRLTSTSNFYFDDVYTRAFTDYGWHLSGVLIGTFNNCLFFLNETHVKNEVKTGTTIGDLAPNLVTFRGCVMSNSVLAVDWSGGSMLKFEDCDFENNTSGVIKTSGMSIGFDDIAVTVDGGWFEGNAGTILEFGEPGGSESKNIVSNSIFNVNTGATEIEITGTTNINEVYLNNTSIGSPGTITKIGTFSNVLGNSYSVAGEERTGLKGYTAIDVGAGLTSMLTYNRSGVIKSVTGVVAANDAIIMGSVTDDMVYRTNNTNIIYSTDLGTTQNFKIKSNGFLQAGSYGAGTLNTDASGNITASSDINLKKDIKPSATGLKEILKLNPIVYSWNVKSGNETKGRYTGFSAQNVMDNIPNGTGVMPDGHLTLQDRAIMAAMVNAIKELEAKIEKLEKLLLIKK